MKKRVVITGMDIVSSIGNGLSAFWNAAKQGQCGIKRIQRYDPSPYPTQMAGEVTDLDLTALPAFDNAKRYPLCTRFAAYCAYHALQHAGLTTTELASTGTFIGTSVGGSAELEAIAFQAFLQGWRKIPALTVIKAMPNSIANQIAIAFGLGGANSTTSNACVSSAEAIGNAYQHIAQGRLTTALCGGTESLIWEAIMAAWCKLRIMSTKNETPHLSCSPFDKARDGMVMAEGAGMLVLEEYHHAKARGASIFAEILGFGTSCDAHHITAPHSAGQIRAIHAALNEAQLAPSDIQYINAHGTGTQLNDITETETIKSVFGAHAPQIPITAQKAMTGHAIGAAGAMEIIASVLSLQHDLLLPTINLNRPDPACDLDYIPHIARPRAVDIVLSNHFAFGGANAAFILKRL